MEREGKALIAVTDQWSNWQNVSGVQTSWSDGTVLYDYSVHGNQTITVYGGGKVDLSIPPCDGSANLGRRGYAIWAPQGIVENYSNPSKQTTQEWEMSNDLGDRHNYSLCRRSYPIIHWNVELLVEFFRPIRNHGRPIS